MPLADVLARFNAAFNANDLDGVMTYFAPDAIYLPGDGTEHRGAAAIRRAFAPQFAGRFGAMRFDVEDELVDEAARKATTRWTCRHDLSDAQLRISGKFTYANYDRPQLRRDVA